MSTPTVNSIQSDPSAPRSFVPSTRLLTFTRFNDWQMMPDQEGGHALVSPPLDPGLDWKELIVSWNVRPAHIEALEIQVSLPPSPSSSGRFSLGRWAFSTNVHLRCSVPGQKDAMGEVQTDTLVVQQPARTLQLRLRFPANQDPTRSYPKMMALSFLGALDRGTPAAPRKPTVRRVLPVPERTQLDSPGGEVWCSPTATSMILAYWGEQLKRPELNRPVAEVAQAVYDPHWPGTGNWPFNMAYAGSYEDLRAYVHRLPNVEALESWIEAGVPVALSVSYNRLKGKPVGGRGHLVVCVGFTAEGEIVINDPGVRTGIRRAIPRATVERAWAESKNTVYLVHPDRWPVPRVR